MSEFLDVIIRFPTAIWTTLLLVLLGYWALAILGLVDFDSLGGDLELELRGDIDGADLSAYATYVVAVGLNGVPFSIVASLLVLVAWVLSSLAGQWLLPWVPTWPLQMVAGAAVLVLSLVLSVLATARLVRPMRGLFVTHLARGNASLVGSTCRVASLRVDERHGNAEVAQRGASLLIQVWAETPNQLTKGDAAVVLEYDAARGRYLIQAADLADASS